MPWLVLLQQVRGRAAFWWSWLIGFIFFLGSIWWLIHVTLFGWVLLCAYLALYFGVFGYATQWSLTHHPASSIHHFLIPAVWVALEYTRSHLLSGFGWNLLAYSQASYVPLIRIVDVTGTWGMSFLLVLVNVAFAVWMDSHSSRRVCAIVSLVAAAGMAVTLLYGFSQPRTRRPIPPFSVSVVQGNIPQEEKWDEAHKDQILTRYEALTNEAAATQPDLIVWPETSVPGFFGVDEELTQRIIRLASVVQRPLLVGSPAPHLTPDGLSATNRATLLDGSGGIVASYDKLHLVPYGEFVPGDRFFPWLRNLLPPIGDFVPGKEFTVLSAPVQRSSSQLKFSVLICFEDIFPELARQFVRQGAQTLVVITNDAWFGPTAAAYQHTQASIFRAVELGVPVIRAANTGWSGCIDPEWGAYRSVKEAGQALFVPGTVTCDTYPGSRPTRYVRWGDWFAWLCVFSVVVWLVERRLNLF